MAKMGITCLIGTRTCHMQDPSFVDIECVVHGTQILNLALLTTNFDSTGPAAQINFMGHAQTAETGRASTQHESLVEGVQCVRNQGRNAQ